MSRLVVADTGPLIHLAQADALSLLELTGEVLVPKTVLDELDRGPTDMSEFEFSVEQVDIDTGSVYTHLDPGETAALVVCTERDAILLTDDMDARDTANEQGIEVHGSVGVVQAIEATAPGLDPGVSSRCHNCNKNLIAF